MCPVVINEKTFIHYSDALEEIRMMIINEMECTDRVRFTRSSTLCNREAKRSKNYIHGLKFVAHGEHCFNIHVLHGKYGITYNGFRLKFEETYDDKKKIFYNSLIHYNIMDGEQKWKINLPFDKNMLQFASRCFAQLFNLYQHKIRKLVIKGKWYKKSLGLLKYGIKKLNNLETVKVDDGCYLLPLISKLQRPLLSLYVYKKNNTRIVTENDLQFSVREKLVMPCLKLDYEQFQQLSATWRELNIGHLTEVNIYNIVSSWKRGTNKQIIDEYHFELAGSKFDVKKLSRLLTSDGNYLSKRKFFAIYRDGSTEHMASIEFHEQINRLKFGTNDCYMQQQFEH